MRSYLLLSALLAPLALAACGGADASPAPRTGATPTSTAPDAETQAQCEAFFTRARACTDAYIPALVDLRISLDKPAGIAAEGATPDGRASLIEQAKGEWANDSQPANIASMCANVTAKTPADKLAGLRAKATECLAASACDAFATCSMDLQRAVWQ